MSRTNETKEAQGRRDDIIELGVASVETQGGIGDDEFMGVLALPGISEE